MQLIPLQAVPSQIVITRLVNQACLIKVYHKFFGLFCDLSVFSNAVGSYQLIIGGVLCENLNRIVRSIYLGFIGDLTFIDSQGSNDPDFEGIGTRFNLFYLELTDLPPVPSLIPVTATSIAVPAQGQLSSATSGVVTLPSGQTSVTVQTLACTLASIIDLTPMTADAAASVPTTYVTPSVASFVITFANNANTDRIFGWSLR